jgi:CheY-like chemotaxis protein
VLVVDDDLDVLYYVDDVLQELGCRPLKATSAEEAAEIVGAIRLDALVMDLEMVVGASVETLDHLIAAHGPAPVLLMSDDGRQPEGSLTPSRCFTEHPPDTSGLQGALTACLGAVPARPSR